MRRYNSYADHVDAIVALVSHLAMTEKESMTAKTLATKVSLDQGEVVYVLDSFKGLFRKHTSSVEHGEHYYSLQLRYARKWLEGRPATHVPDDSRGQVKEPLLPEYVTSLLSFISNMVGQEFTTKRQRSQNLVAIIGAWVAATAAIVAAIIGLTR
jgi:hypothetical protein